MIPVKAKAQRDLAKYPNPQDEPLEVMHQRLGMPPPATLEDGPNWADQDPRRPLPNPPGSSLTK